MPFLTPVAGAVTTLLLALPVTCFTTTGLSGLALEPSRQLLERNGGVGVPYNRASATRLGVSSSWGSQSGLYDFDDDSFSDNLSKPQGSEDLLLRVDFVQGMRGQEKPLLVSWVKRFPFGVALPVQPFSLNVQEDGVDLLFRKKPTNGNKGKDGGIRFGIVEWESESADGARKDRCSLVARRISEGQAIRKVIAEKTVVTKMLERIEKELYLSGGRMRLLPPMLAVFHPYMAEGEGSFLEA